MLHSYCVAHVERSGRIVVQSGPNRPAVGGRKRLALLHTGTSHLRPVGRIKPDLRLDDTDSRPGRYRRHAYGSVHWTQWCRSAHCYGNGTGDKSLAGTKGPDGEPWCYDPTNGDKGQHGYPYVYQAWAYDLSDFAAVKAGTKQPWEVVPYGVWPLGFPTSEATVRLGGVGYDAQRQLLYVAQTGADPDGYSYRPVIHVFRVNAPPSAPTSPAKSTVSLVTLTTDKTAPQAPETAITFTAQPSGGVHCTVQVVDLRRRDADGRRELDGQQQDDLDATSRESEARGLPSGYTSAGNTADALEASTSLAFPIVAAPNAAASRPRSRSLPTAWRRRRR